MEAELKTTDIDRYVSVCCAALDKEETAECVVPDVLPDIAQILYTQACVLLRGKESEDGRATVTASLECSVIYTPEGGTGLRKLGLTIPFSASVESGELREDSRLIARVSLNSVDARTLNPRKVLVRAEVHICLEAYAPVTTTITEDAAPDSGIQTLCRTVQVTEPGCVTEKTFVLSDEFRFPPARPAPSELLGYRLSVMTEEIKAVGSKLIFKGTVTTTLLCLSGEGELPSSESFTTTFSQLLEVEGSAEELLPELSLMPTGVYVEQAPAAYGSGIFTCELHLVAQAVCRRPREIVYLADAYSCERAAQLRTETLRFGRMGRELTLRETTRELLETPTAVRELVEASAQIGPASVTDGVATTRVTVCALYTTEDGGIASASKTLQISSRLETEDGTEARILAVRCGELYAMPASGGLEMRIPVEFVLSLSEPVVIPCVTAIELDEEGFGVTERPSVVVVRAGGEDPWSLAKRYFSTPALIASANPETPEENGVLLIPRAR